MTSFWSKKTLIQSHQLNMPIWLRLIRAQPTLWDQCVYLGPRSSRSTQRARDAQVSSAESLPHLSPRPICSIHTQWRQVTATARLYKSTDDHQVLRPYARKNSVNVKCNSSWCRQEVNVSIKMLKSPKIYECLHFPIPDDVLKWRKIKRLSELFAQ